jgi:iron(III) transport system substrate-binding protein
MASRCRSGAGATAPCCSRSCRNAAPGCCVVSSGTPSLEPLHREQLLQAVRSPTLTELMPQALRPHGEWVGISINIISAAYHQLVRPSECPELQRPQDQRWKGRLAIEADDVDWFAAVVGKLGEAPAQLFRDIVRSNGVSRAGPHAHVQHGGGGRDTARIRSTATSPTSCTGGRPIRTLYLAPVIALATGVSVTAATRP